MKRDQIAAESRKKNLEGPRVAQEEIDKLLAEAENDVQYHVFPGTTVTVCAIKLKSGFVLIGYSACVSEEDFDQELGEKVAYDKAVERLWKLEAYRLKVQLNCDK